MKIAATLRKRVRLGRLGLPVWLLGVAGLTIAAAAGQAVGPVLTGSTSGSTNLVVSQAVTLDTTLSLNPRTTTSASATSLFGANENVDDAVGTRNDEGTAFTVAAEVNVGQRFAVVLYLANSSGRDASAILELNVPPGIDVELTEVSRGTKDDSTYVQEAQLSRNHWLVVIEGTEEAGKESGIKLNVETKDDLRPGFYTITGRIVQTSG